MNTKIINVLIDVPKLSKRNGGVYQYSILLLNILAKGDLPFNFYIFCKKPDYDIKEIVEGKSNFNFTRIQKCHSYSCLKFIHRMINFLFRKLSIKKRLQIVDLYDCLIKDYCIDIIHTPMQSVIKKPNVKSITTLHDVQELHFPEFFTSTERAHRAVHFKRAIDEADAVIVSYNHVRNDIVKYFEKSQNQVYTVLLDMQNLWFNRIANSNFSDFKKLNLPSNFLLYPAATWEHKNHLRLIQSIKFLNKSDIYLLCTGHQTEYYVKNIKPVIEENELSAQIMFLGIVSDEVLFELYQNCRAVVVPTLYEAGSFPLVESILMGIPVVCSNVTSLPETIGDSRFVFDPTNIEDIAMKINKIWSDDNFRKENVDLLKVQANKLKFNNAALKISKIYEDLMSQE